MTTSELRKVTKYSNYVDSGMEPTPGTGDALNISAGIININGKDTHVDAESNLSLTAPASSGNIRRNYVRIHKTTFAYSIYATTEGAAGVAIEEKYFNSDSDTSPEAEDHYLYEYLFYVDVDDDVTTVTGDIYDIRPKIGRGA